MAKDRGDVCDMIEILEKLGLDVVICINRISRFK